MKIFKKIKLKELKFVNQIWLKIIKKNYIISHENDIEKRNINDEKNIKQILKDIK